MPDNPHFVQGLYELVFSDFFVLKFLMFLNKLCIYGSNGLWSSATSISDGIFPLKLVRFSTKETPEKSLLTIQLFLAIFTDFLGKNMALE